MFGRIKFRRTDTLFSLYLRQKRGYRCEKCGGFWPQGKGLTVSHFWTRAKESVRFDEENIDVLWFACHSYFENKKGKNGEYEVWKKNRMGEKAFNLLMVRAHTPGKRDAKFAAMWIKKLMKEQNSEMHDL
jgi:hypothetical protein